MRRPGRLLVGLSVVAALAVVPPAAPAPARADAHRTIKLADFFDLAVDEAHGHVYVSQGRRTDGLVVFDLSGRPIATVEGLGAAQGLLLSPDGTTLYVALADHHSIAEIDTATLEVVDEIALPSWSDDGEQSRSCPVDLTMMDGFLIFGDACRNAPNALRMLDLATGDVVVTHRASGDERLALSPEHGILLVTSSGGVVSYDVATSPTPSITYRDQSQDMPAPHDLSLVPGTDRVVLDVGRVLDIDDLSVVEKFPVRGPGDDSRGPASAVAMRQDGMFAIGFNRRGNWDLRTFDGLGRPPLRTYTLVDQQRPYELDNSLNFDARSIEFGKRKLYGVEISDFHDHPRFWAITPRSPLRVRASSVESRYPKNATVKVRVKVSDPAAARRGEAHLFVYGDLYNHIDVPYRLDSDGRGSFTFRLTKQTRVTALVDDHGAIVSSRQLVISVRR